MLEGFELDDLADIAESLPGPHAWAHGTADIFFCQPCYVGFEFGVDPVPQGPCEPFYPMAVVYVDVEPEPGPVDAAATIDDEVAF